LLIYSKNNMLGCDEKSLPWLIMAVVIVATIAILWYWCTAVKSAGEHLVLGKEWLTARQAAGVEGLKLREPSYCGKERRALGKEGLVLGKEGLVLGKEGLVLGKEQLTARQAAGIEGLVPQYISREGLNPSVNRVFPGESYVLGKEMMSGVPVKDIGAGDLQALLY
jgi:hypothetical protein